MIGIILVFAVLIFSRRIQHFGRSMSEHIVAGCNQFSLYLCQYKKEACKACYNTEQLDTSITACNRQLDLVDF